MSIQQAAALRVHQRGAIPGIPMDWLDRILETLRQEFAGEAWRWYRAHAEDVVYRQRVLWTFWVEVRVQDLRGLFELLFEEEEVA